MLSRCRNKNSTAYIYYGARGISVCKRWHKFENFINDMGHPKAGESIDRIDNDGDYKPSNCAWATSKTQGNNNRRNHVIKHNGDEKTLSEWSDSLGVKANTILTRIRRGWSISESLGVDARVNKRQERMKSRERECIRCGGEFTPRQYQIDQGQGKYCSLNCSRKRMTGLAVWRYGQSNGALAVNYGERTRMTQTATFRPIVTQTLSI